MRIWLAPAAYWPNLGGIEELTAQLAKALISRGHSVLVVTHRWPIETSEREVVDGVKILRLDFSAPSRSVADGRKFLASIPSVWTRLKAEAPPDVIHLQGAASQTFHLAAFARARRIPLIITTQGEVLMDAGGIYQSSSYQRLSLRVASRAAAALTACSQWTIDATAPIIPAFASAEVIANGFLAEDWADLPQPTGQPVLAAWGRHVPQKGFDRLLVAFAALREQRPSARLLLGGAGAETERLKGLAGPNVTFLGSLDRTGVRGLLSQARVAVIPSVIEPFGIVALEALASGRRVVYSNVGGLLEAVGPMGRPVDVDDVAGFAATMLAALDDEPRDPSGWLAAFGWARITDAYERVYRRVTGTT